MRTVAGIVTAMGLGLTAAASPAAGQVPQIPSTFYGAVTIDGQAPSPDTPVRAFIDGRDCTQPGAAGSIPAGDVGAYVISVMHETQQPGCGSDGKHVTFTIAGLPAGQTATWRMGVQELSLNAGSGAPQPLPADIPTRTARAATQATSTAAGSSPTADVELAQTQTPRPPGLSTPEDEDDDGLPLWGILVVALLGFGVLAGAAGFALSRGGSGSAPPEG